MESEFNYNTETSKKTSHLVFLLVGVTVCLTFIILYGVSMHLNTPDPQFPLQKTITIEEGLSLSKITHVLKENNVVRSSLFLRFYLWRNHSGAFIQAGTYQFESPQTTHEIARALTEGTNLIPLVTLTLPEGFRADDFYSFLPPLLIISPQPSLKEYEGYLFPETYFVSTNATLEELLHLLTNTFTERLVPYADEIARSGFTEEEVIILASILEREAKDITSKRMVSGILQNRLRIAMPLQVDATFDYILGKTSAELTEEDLMIDSPYNTYTNQDLPPTPIANPGIESVEAVLNPIENSYLYYLTAPDGTFYYAETFEEHKQNKFAHLR